MVGESITFDASSSFQPSGKITDYTWYISGSEYSGEIVDTEFEKAGNHTVGLRVMNGNDKSTYFTREVRVGSPPPEAGFFYVPEDPLVQRKVWFNASPSSDQDNIQQYTWKLGDGTTKTGTNITHVYEEYGEYEVRLTASGTSKDSSVTRTVVIDNAEPEPVVEVYPTNRTTIDGTVILNGTSSHDPDGGSIKRYTWSLGDGSTVSGPVANHSYDSPGLYEVILTVSDGIDTESKKFNISVVNRPPNAAFEYSPKEEIRVSDSITFDASNSYDPDRETLNYTWNFGDGGVRRGVIVNHTYDELGTYEVTLEVEDSVRTDTERRYITVGPGKESADGFGVFSFLTSVILLVALGFSIDIN
jgi:PKD repeat protein